MYATACSRLRHLLPALLFAALAFPLAARAQTPAAAPAASSGTYWVFFADKPGDAAVEPGRVTERALARRARRGTPSPPGLDAPVPERYLASLRAMGVTPRVESRWLNAVSAELAAGQVAAVAALPFVRGLRPVARLDVAAPDVTPVSPVFTAPVMTKGADLLDYGLSRRQLEVVNAVAPLERGVNGEGVVLGFLDAEFGGFEEPFLHPAFDHLRASGRLLGYRNFTIGSQGFLGDHVNHGRNVASIAVGYAPGWVIGPAWGASVLLATTEYVPSETNVEEDQFVEGLEWLEAQGVDVVNASLGYTTFDAGQRDYSPEDLDGDTGVTTVAADRAVALGVVFVTSAGNEAATFRYIGTPADGDSVIAVGGVRPDSSRYAASSYGPTADGRIKPDLAAQATAVWHASGAGSFSSGSGTSYASPMVAGVVCQILQVNPGLNPIEIRDLLRRTASQATAPDNSLGWGIINADAAILEAATMLGNGTLPEALRVDAPYPNPSPGPVTFEVHAPAPLAGVRLTVYDVLGRRVGEPVQYPVVGGVRRLTYDGNDLAPGVYLYVLEGAGARATGRLVIAR